MPSRSQPAARRKVASFSLLIALAAAAAGGCSARREEPSPPAGSETAIRGQIRDLKPGQLRVCTFSFNRPHELSEIKSHLPGNKFEVTDLTPVFAGGPNPPPASTATTASVLGSSKPGWLASLCRADLRCDVLIYSGEFAGGFFGEQGISLPVQEMEEASCQSRCDGLFHQPREVFLLGCNTLATKSADSRTPEQYLQVLLEHGFNRADAERAVDLRYGPLGPSFRESVRRVFSGVPRIYGFNSVAPRGEVTAPRLRRYFTKKGDYARYLEKSGRDAGTNKDLLAAFSGTGLTQASGLMPADDASADQAMVCSLYDESQSVEQRLRVVGKMFSRRDFLVFVPTVEVFLRRHPPENFDGEQRKAFALVQSLPEPKRQILELTKRLDVSAQKFQLASLARELGWMTPAEYDQLASAGIRQLLADPSSTDIADIGCELTQQVPSGRALRSEELPEPLFWHSEGYRFLDCLAPTDPRVSARMMVGLQSIDESTRQWAAYALSHRLPLDEAVQLDLTRRLNDPSPTLRQRVRSILAAQTPLPPKVQAAVLERDPELAEAIQAAAKESERAAAKSRRLSANRRGR